MSQAQAAHEASPAAASAQHAPSSAPEGPVDGGQQLQRALGNGFLGQAGDATAERHADAVAEALLPLVEATSLPGPAKPGPDAQTGRPSVRDPAPPIGRSADAAVIAGVGSPGEPLPPALATALGLPLGVDLTSVRLHRGATAAASADALGARAYAFGADVVLGAEWQGLGTAAGRRLLAHELAHVAGQARQGSARVQRDEIVGAQPSVPAFDTLDTLDTGEDPATVIGQLPRVFSALRTVTLDEVAVRSGVPPAVLRPSECFLYTENYIAIIRADGTVRDLLEQDTRKPTMISASVLVLREKRTGRVWFVGLRGEQIAIRSFSRYAGVPEPLRPAGESVLVLFMPGVVMSAELAKSLRRRARGASGTSAETPEWARATTSRLRRRRGGSGISGDGPGAGRTGEGTGGGGTADRTSENATGGGGTGTGSGTGAGTGSDAEPGTEPGRPLRGPATYTTTVTPAGDPQLTITIDRAVTNLPLREGESEGSLDRRVDAAEQVLQESRDPDSPANQLVVDPATRTGFAPPPRGSRAAEVAPDKAQAQSRSSRTAVTPGEHVPGGRTGANAPPYPAEVLMGGIERGEPATSTSGATNRFTIKLDYAARSLGFQDEVFNRMQTVQYYWEIIDVTALTQDKDASQLSQAEADALARTKRVGTGEAQSAFSGAGADLSRTAEDVAVDQQKDLDMMSQEDWPWSARAAYLGVIGLSNAVRLLGSIIGSFIDVITQPLNERSIGFDREGDFLVRCVASPQWSDAARDDPDHHVLRASSVGVRPVRITNVSTRAAEGADQEAKSLADARAQLAAAIASGDPRQIAAARAGLARLESAARLSGFDTFSQTTDGLRRTITVGEALQRHLVQHAADSALSDDEVLLQIQLLRTGQSVDAFLEAKRRQLTQFAGEGGEHEAWVRSQHGRFVAVGGVSDFRPRMALASRENGQVTEVRTMLGELQGSREGARQWGLVDITSSGSRDIYIGRSALPGHGGQVAAIRDAFRNFAENSGYGRGTLAIRLPADLSVALGAPVTIERAMESAPGAKGRVLQRLRDLATVAEIAGLFATGGLGVAIGTVGGVAGAITAIDSLARRARTGHSWEVGTIFDVLGAVGGVASTLSVGAFIARDVVEAGRAAGRLPGWVSRLERVENVLHIHGMIGNVQQLITIPVQLAIEWDEIDQMTGLTEGERDSRRARALLGALKSGAVTIVSMGGGLGSHDTEPRSRAGGEVDPLPPGTGSREANSVAEGGGGSRPPVRELGEPGGAARAPSAAGEPTTVREPAPPREPSAAREPATAGEPTAGGAGERPVTDLVAQARELAARRLAEARRAGADDHTPRPGEEPGRRPADEGEGTTRTAAGTPRAGEDATPGGRMADANAGERDLAVEILGFRMGRERPPGPADRNAPRPRPGAFAERTTLGEQAVATYDRAVANSGGAEVGLFYNANTGEFAVQMGTEFSVRGPAGDGWRALVHLHPNPENVVIRRLPAPADISMAVRAAFRTGSHTEYVQSTRPDGSTGITRVEVTTNPLRIVVDMPASAGESARRITVDSPEAYAREYGDQTTHMDPSSPLFEWVLRDLDEFYRREDAGRDPDTGEATGAGTARTVEDPTAPSTGAAGTGTGAGPEGGPGAGADERTAVGTPRPGRRRRGDPGAPLTGPGAPARLTGPGSVGEEVHTQAQRVLGAWTAGHTLEAGGGAPLPVGHPDAPGLTEAMTRLRAAVDRYRRSEGGDPATVRNALMNLRRRTALAGEMLRAAASGFEVTPLTAEVLPPSRPPAPGTVAEPGSAAALAGTARARAAALGPLDQVTSATLFDALHLNSPEFIAEGTLRESLTRGEVPDVGLEGYVLGSAGIRALETDPPGLADRLADAVSGWERAHLIGPGFGAEEFLGIMLAPWGVNQVAQRTGIEAFLRAARDAGVATEPQIRVSGRRLAIPLADGGYDHVDIMTAIHYEIPRAGAPALVFDITVHPDGSWTAAHNLPPGTPGSGVALSGTR